MATTTQQFVLNDDTMVDTSRIIRTDFYETVMYLHLFKKTPNMGGYIQIPYFMPSGVIRENVNYITSTSTTKYKCKNLYIFKATHNVLTNDSYDGELVIELEPVTTNSNTLYLCFLLKNIRFSNDNPSPLDKIIQIANTPPANYTTMNFTYQSMFDNNQKKIIYSSGVDTVVIYTTPIPIQEIDFSVFSQIPTSLFAIYPTGSAYNILNNVETEGFQEGKGRRRKKRHHKNTNAPGKTAVAAALPPTNRPNKKSGKFFGIDKIMTCSPIDINDPSKPPKGKNTATYLMDNKAAQQEKHLGVVYAMTIFLIMLFGAYFGGPPIYKLLIIDRNKTSNNLMLSTILFLFFVLLLGFILLLNGAVYDSIESMVGMMILIFTTLSIVSVFNKRSSDEDYRKPGNSGSSVDFKMDGNLGTVIVQFFKTITDDTLGKYFLPNNANLGIGLYWLMLLIILIIPCAVIGAKKDKQANNKEKRKKGYRNNLIGLVMGIGSVYGFAALTFLFSISYTLPS